MNSSERLLEAHLYGINQLWPLLLQEDYPPLGIWAQSAVQQARLDGSPESLLRLDALLDWLGLQGADWQAQPDGQNLLHLLGIWLLGQTGRPIQRYQLPELARLDWPDHYVHPQGLWVAVSNETLLDPFAVIFARFAAAGSEAPARSSADWVAQPRVPTRSNPNAPLIVPRSQAPARSVSVAQEPARDSQGRGASEQASTPTQRGAGDFEPSLPKPVEPVKIAPEQAVAIAAVMASQLPEQPATAVTELDPRVTVATGESLNELDRMALVEQLRQQQQEIRSQWQDPRMPLWKMMAWGGLLIGLLLVVFVGIR